MKGKKKQEPKERVRIQKDVVKENKQILIKAKREK